MDSSYLPTVRRLTHWLCRPLHNNKGRPNRNTTSLSSLSFAASSSPRPAASFHRFPNGLHLPPLTPSPIQVGKLASPFPVFQRRELAKCVDENIIRAASAHAADQISLAQQLHLQLPCPPSALRQTAVNTLMSPKILRDATSCHVTPPPSPLIPLFLLACAGLHAAYMHVAR